MACDLLTLADDLVTQLGAMVAAAGGSITRAYVPRLRVEEAGSLIVTVVPRAEQGVRIARGVWQKDPIVDIGIEKKVADDAAMDAMMLFAQTMAEFCQDMTPAAGVAVVQDVDWAYSQSVFDQWQVFSAGIAVTFRKDRRG